jgi:hypothetical protein
MPDEVRLAAALVSLVVELAPAALLVVAVGVLAGVADVMSPSLGGCRRGGRS